jgi:hypothetical protein
MCKVKAKKKTVAKVARYGRCQVCGCKVGPTSDICGECMCEDDWY